VNRLMIMYHSEWEEMTRSLRKLLNAEENVCIVHFNIIVTMTNEMPMLSHIHKSKTIGMGWPCCENG
jgi:hypothetical protein